MSGELLPLACGVSLGTLIALAPAELRARVLVLLVALSAVAATIGSGEYLVSWSFVLIDAALVLAAAGVTFTVARRFSWAG